MPRLVARRADVDRSRCAGGVVPAGNGARPWCAGRLPPSLSPFRVRRVVPQHPPELLQHLDCGRMIPAQRVSQRGGAPPVPRVHFRATGGGGRGGKRVRGGYNIKHIFYRRGSGVISSALAYKIWLTAGPSPPPGLTRRPKASARPRPAPRSQPREARCARRSCGDGRRSGWSRTRS